MKTTTTQGTTRKKPRGRPGVSLSAAVGPQHQHREEKGRLMKWSLLMVAVIELFVWSEQKKALATCFIISYFNIEELVVISGGRHTNTHLQQRLVSLTGSLVTLWKKKGGFVGKTHFNWSKFVVTCVLLSDSLVGFLVGKHFFWFSLQMANFKNDHYDMFLLVTSPTGIFPR